MQSPYYYCKLNYYHMGMTVCLGQTTLDFVQAKAEKEDIVWFLQQIFEILTIHIPFRPLIVRLESKIFKSLRSSGKTHTHTHTHTHTDYMYTHRMIITCITLRLYSG